MQIIKTTALITINATLIVQLISFLLFVFIIKRVMLRPLRGIMEKREGYMGEMQRDIAANRENLAAQTRQMEKRRDAAKLQAFRAVQELEAAGRKQADEIVACAGSEIASLRESAQKDIAVLVADTRKKIQAEIEPMAFHIMERVLERRLTS